MSDSTIYKDPIKQYHYSSYHTDIETIHNMFIDIKASLEEHASDWFSNVEISTYLDNDQTYYKITMYDMDGDPVMSIKQHNYTTSSASYNVGYYIEIIAHAATMDVTNNNTSFTANYVKSGRLWFISRITYHEKFISFSFISTEGGDSVDDIYRQGSSIFLVKTAHGNIAMVRGNNGNGDVTSSDSIWPGPTNSAFHINTRTMNRINRLSCVTKESVSVGSDMAAIFGLNASQEMIFTLRNIAVVGVSDDYCIDTYYAASMPYVLSDATDCIMTLGDADYFTNGVVFVKL
jgi:hypothetical protein